MEVSHVEIYCITVRGHKDKKIKNFRKLVCFNRNNMISMTGFSLVGFNEELAKLGELCEQFNTARDEKPDT